MPIGIPGCPDCARSTASIANARSASAIDFCETSPIVAAKKGDYIRARRSAIFLAIPKARNRRRRRGFYLIGEKPRPPL